MEPFNRLSVLSALLLFLVLIAATTQAADFTLDPRKPLVDGTHIESSRPTSPVDLDLGFNNFIDIRLKAGRKPAGGMLVQFGTIATPIEDPGREIRIPAAQISGDGRAHTYRLDMGLNVWWRSTLIGLSVEFPDEHGKAATVESVIVGERPGDEYESDLAANAPHELVSKHFRILWGSGTSEKFTEEQAHGSLRNFEAAWQVYTKLLKLWPVGVHGRTRLRTNITTMKAGHETAAGVVNIDPTGLRVDPPSWVIPYELMHAFQEAQRGHMAGDWGESYANYGNERVVRCFSNLFPGETTFDPNFATMAHWYLSNGRDCSLCWPIWTYLDENPDNLAGLGEPFTGRLWKDATQDEEFFHIVFRLAPKVNILDLVGLYARRAVAWDYANHAAMERKMTEFLADPVTHRMVYPELVRRPDDPTWWRVPPEMAPQQGAYTIHELAPDPAESGHPVTINFRGLPDRERHANWRVSLVARKPDGTFRYSPMFSTGKQIFQLLPGESKLFIVVAATPEQFVFGSQDETLYPWATHPQRQRFPYELQMTGARPMLEKTPAPAKGHRHANGGGFVADSAHVANAAYIGVDAQVLNDATVAATAYVEGSAIVADKAQVLDRAIVSGHAIVRGEAKITDDAVVRDWAIVKDQAHVSGSARILQRATVRETADIRDDATVEGCADVWNEGGKESVGGDAVLCADYGGGRKATNGFQFGFVPIQACPEDWISKRTAPRARYVSYAFEKANDSLVKDGPGITDGILIGNPIWRQLQGKGGLLSFDGKSQAVLLERSVCDFAVATFAVRLNWAGGAADQPIFHFGTSAGNCLYLTPDAGGGHAALIARFGGKEFAVRAAKPVPSGRLVQVAVAMNGRNATVFVEGQSPESGPFPVKPRDFLSIDPVAAPDHDFLCRDSAGRFFHGSLREFKVWSAVLTAEQLKPE